tara:strand:+ start:15679 stop:15957 length:279 start_codon:yes stop_codon:yes gene_type:complete
MGYREKEQILKTEKLNEIRKYVENSDSNLVEHDSDYDYINFSTRENGDVGSETHSEIDLADATKLGDEISAKFGVNPDIETVDEWVHLNIEV